MNVFGKVIRISALLVLVAGVYLLTAGRRFLPDFSWLEIKSVEVASEPPLTEKDIRKALGKIEGSNLLKLDTNELMLKLQKNSWVSSASIRKLYPSRLTVQVQTRKPAAAVHSNGKLVFVDENGDEIDRWATGKGLDFDLPIVAFERPEHSKQWSTKTLLNVLVSLQKEIAPKFKVSQLIAIDPPYFKIFLSTPPLETLFSLHTWDVQLPFFVDLLSRPPRQIGQAHRINLVFPKKAVVSFPLSN
jgi:hypothetical protein